MDTPISATDLASVISRCTGVAVTGEQVADEGLSFADLGVDSLGLMGVLGELRRSHGAPPEVDLTTGQSPRELLSLLGGGS